VLTALYVVRAASGWLVVLSRYRLVHQRGTPRLFWVSVLCATVGATVQVFAVYKSVAALLGDSRYASVLLLSLALFSALANRVVLMSLMGRTARSANWDCLAVAVAFGVMVLPVLTAHGAPPPATCVGTCGFMDHTWRSWVHWLPVLAYMAWSFTSSCIFCYQYGNRSERPAVRTGLWLISAGAALALAWVALRVAALAAWHAGLVTPHFVSVDDWAEALIWVTSMNLVGIGAVWEPLGDQARAAREWARALRSLWRLRGLWRALTASRPEVTLVGAPWRLRPVRLALVRCVVEIRDCLREIELSVRSEVLAAIDHHVVSNHGALHPDGDALVTAAMLRWWVSEQPATGAGGCHLPLSSARDLAADASWLEQVARYFAGSGSGLTEAAVVAARRELVA
jgi:hypothetical protein